MSNEAQDRFMEDTPCPDAAGEPSKETSSTAEHHSEALSSAETLAQEPDSAPFAFDINLPLRLYEIDNRGDCKNSDSVTSMPRLFQNDFKSL